MQIKRRIYLFFYCLAMRQLWNIGYNLYNWAENRRPPGGFRVKNYYR